MNRNPQFAADAAWLERDWGIVFPYAQDYLPDEFRRNWDLACDAQPTLVTNPSGGIPSFFTQFVDPDLVRVLQVPNKGAEILGEVKKGTWVDSTAWFPMIENTGEVSSYGDYNNNGVSDVTAQFESRQAYLFQVIIKYGDLEVVRAGAARLNWVSEKQMAAAKTLDKFSDYTYHFGVAGLANYGILNDPSLPAALTPSTKASTNVRWMTGNQVTAQAAEIYGDIQTLYAQLNSQTNGYINEESDLVLVLPNTVNAALTATNQFGITTRAFVKQSFPNMSFITDPRYATVAGNVIQLIARSFDGNKTGECGFNEKMRDHQIVRDLSAFAQKRTSGSWGCIIRYPLAFAQMIGV